MTQLLEEGFVLRMRVQIVQNKVKCIHPVLVINYNNIHAYKYKFYIHPFILNYHPGLQLQLSAATDTGIWL